MQPPDRDASPGPLPLLRSGDSFVAADRRPLRVIAVALGLAVLAVAATAMVPALADASPFLLSFAAVSASGWYGGLLGGAVATLATTVGVSAVVIAPGWPFAPAADADLVRLLTYLGLSSVVTWFNTNVHAARRQLRASEFLSRVVVENAPALIAGADQHGRIVLFNEACERATGFRRDEVLGRPFVETLVPFPWRSQVIARFDPASGIDLREPHRNPWRTSSGGERLIEWRCYRVPSGSGTLTVGVGNDVTDRKRLEDELAGRERFIATLSHELRTPLNVVLGWSTHLRNMAQDDEVRRSAGYITRNAELISRLVADVLDMARIAAGKMTVRPVRLELNAVARASVDAIRPLAEAKSLSIAVQSAADYILVNGDPDRLQQMIFNLLTNAVKFTPPGGTITVIARAEGDWAEIAVRDTGPGIDDAEAEKLFQPFWQADGHNGGLGLGLALVRQLAELHGGSARITRASDQGGTIVSFRVPTTSYSEAQLA